MPAAGPPIDTDVGAGGSEPVSVVAITGGGVIVVPGTQLSSPRGANTLRPCAESGWSCPMS